MSSDEGLKRWGIPAAAVLALILFLNILPNTFIWDDRPQIFQNPLLLAPDGLIRVFNTNVWGFEGQESNYYRPLMHVTFYGALRLFGENPAGYHFLSILLHVFCTVFAGLLILRWSGDRKIAVVAALLFAAHPIHSENVCWISGYPDLEASFFTLAALLIYTVPRVQPLRAVGVAVCFLLALLSKETGIAVPVICVAWDLFQRRRAQWSAYFAMAAAFVAYMALRIHALGGVMPFVQRDALPARERFFTGITLCYRYLEMLVWPAHLTAFHKFPISDGLLDWRVLAGLIVIGAFVWGVARLWRARRAEAVGLIMAAVVLAPAFSLPYGGFNLIAERYTYLPSVVFCWLIAWGWLELGGRFGEKHVVIVVIGLVVLLVAYGVRLEARNLDWASEIPFYRKSIAMAPDIAELHTLLGEAYLRRDMLPEALEETRTAASLKPRYAEAANNLGQVYSLMGDPAKAAEQYRLAIQYERPGSNYSLARMYNNLAYELNRLGQTDESVAMYRKAIQLNPAFAGAFSNLGYLYLEHGQYRESEEALREAVRLEPSSAKAVSNLGLLYVRTGQLDLAARTLNEALKLEPRSGETWARLGDLAVAKGDRQEARTLYQRALELHPGNKRATEGLKQ